MCTFGSFSCIRKGTRRAGADSPHPSAACGTHLINKVTCCVAAQKAPPARKGGAHGEGPLTPNP